MAIAKCWIPLPVVDMVDIVMEVELLLASLNLEAIAE